MLLGISSISTISACFLAFFPNYTCVSQVVLPTGTMLRVVVKTGQLEVVVIPSSADQGQTEGLCGSYDGDSSNDLMALTKEQFAASWRYHFFLFLFQ